ncbi:MAG: polysaccharide deacetylase family protein [Thermoleophilia bacterium]|nr:polysaccharide deacetylase family protein [Thermoleophilia bacterium]
MDEDQLAELKDWARRLRSQGDSAELRAAGRALDLATAEIERLRAERLAPPASAPAPDPAPRESRRRTRRIFDVEAEDEEAEPLDRAPGRADARRNGTATALVERPPGPQVDEPIRFDGGDGHDGQAAPLGLRRPRRLRPVRGAPRPLPLPGRRTLAAAAAAALVVGAGLAAVRIAAPDLEIGGPPPDAKIGAADLPVLTFAVRGDAGTLRDTRWVLDNEDVTARVRRAGEEATLSGATLEDGEHTLTVIAEGDLPGSRTKHVWRFRIDTTPPDVALDAGARKAPVAQPMTFAGAVEEGATVSVNGRKAPIEAGRFSVPFRQPPSQPVRVVVTDAFGNSTTREVTVELVPRRPRAPVRGVHVTFHAWADPALRRGILRLIDEGRINAVELDLKDESGTIGFDARIPLGRQIGAVQPIYDLPAAIDMLHRRGVMVIGRIVAFRDPIHARAAWRRGWRAQVVQTPGRGPYAGYGGFTNFASPAVRRYNIDVARVAAAAGIDDVLYDYVRRPDGPIGGMVFPGLRGAPEQSIASFLAEARRALKPYGTFLGASVFGVAATRPTEVAQPIRAMARNVDYIAPMLYPSHWGPGEYDVPYPNGEPYAIVNRSLRDFQRRVRGTGARVVPWLQDFSLGVSYGTAEVRAQIQAAAAVGIREWLLWDPNVTYTEGALTPGAKLGPIETERKQLVPAPALTNPKPAARRDAPAGQPNELGEVPVIMYHQIRADGGGDYDLTAAEFRAELERLWREGYRPVRAVDLVTGRLDVPAGKSPVVLTFDDSTKEQLALDASGEIKPDTAIGIMLDFAEQHPGFEPAGTFYPNREPFAGVAEGSDLLRWLVEHGFELGNHTKDHIPLNQMSAQEARRQLVLGAKLITDAVPDARVRTLALPLGGWPTPRSIAWRGRWNGKSYRHDGVFMVGAEPSKSPFSRAFDAHAIPRIRTSPRGASEPEYGSTWWLDILRREPGRRYVSDGDPDSISFPRERSSELAPRFRDRAKPY